MTWLKVSVFINTRMEANMLAIGIKISNMVSERRNGTTPACTKDSTRMPAKKVKESTAGQMVIDI